MGLTVTSLGSDSLLDGGTNFENVTLVFRIRQAFTFSLKPVVLSLVILPPRGPWQCLETFVCDTVAGGGALVFSR